MERIESRDNSRVKEYVKIATSRKQRELSGKFAIEGVKLLGEALRCGLLVEQVFVTEECLKSHSELNVMLEKCPKVLEISAGVEGKISQSQSPQGVYALCKRLDKPENIVKIDSNGSYLALWDLQDPGNVGTILRGADAMGLSGVILSRNCCDLYNLKTIRAAMGSLFRMPVLVTDLNTFLKESGLRSYAAVVTSNARNATQVDFSGSIVVIGNEGNGLSKEQAAACDERITIPMRGNAESLNAAMAATILMWEMARGKMK